MKDTIVAMGRDDAAPTFPATFSANLNRLITQMLSTSQTIAKPTVGASVAAGGSNHGTGFLMGTTAQGAMVSPADGLAWDYSFVETLTLTATSDGFTGGGAVAAQERWSIIGFPGAVSPLNFAWPLGSGTSGSVSTASPDTSTNIVANGNFNTWTVTNVPDNWTIAVGTPGTTVKRDSAPLRSTNSFSLQIVGNGSELTNLQQTLTTLLPETTYALNCWMKSSGGVAAGVVRIRLTDGSSTINDQNGVGNTISENASALTTSYAAVSIFFRTPKILPSTVKIEIALTTAVTNLATVDVTDLMLVAAPQSYTGGAFYLIVPGATAFAIGDTLTQATTNSAVNASFVRLLDQNFNLRTSNLRIPSVGGGGETIHDSLIT
jgi:hypothetical protein